MATLLHEEGSPATYSIAGFQYSAGSPGFVKAIAHAHAAQRRPRCMCTQGGVETYVAKLNDGYVVKRMPETGNQHAASCSHFEPSTDETGLRSLLGTAIREDPTTGLTTLKLAFSMSRSTQHQYEIPEASNQSSSARNDRRLSLRGLLIYLWEQADLMRWQPGFVGKRSWAMVRRRLLQAANDKVIGGRPLLDRLYIPEPFSVEERDAIAWRRSAFWSVATSGTSAPAQMRLLVGELKEVASARCGFKAVVKHVPDQPFIVEEGLYRQMIRRFQPTLDFWNCANDIRMLIIATFTVGASKVPTIVELALMPASRDWIPVEDVFERELLARLTAEGRSFLKNTRYDVRFRETALCATLTDSGDPAPKLFVITDARPEKATPTSQRLQTIDWSWNAREEPIPTLPDHCLENVSDTYRARQF